MRIDLHTHSDASDGTDAPAVLVRNAARSGLDVVAITDHDTTQGWDEASAAAREAGIRLVRGIEISASHRGRSVHLLAYEPDPADPALVAAMREVIERRNARVPAICERLALVGIELGEDAVRRAAGSALAAGRPHVADALVKAGVVRDRAEAFERYLKPGRPAYVHREGYPLLDALGVVTAAGGVPVLAHPWGRGSQDVLDAREIELLRRAGLVGVEVDHQDHTPEQRARLRGLAEDLDLVVTGSSDHHGLGKVDHDLGVHTTDPEQFERLVAGVRRFSGDPSTG